MLLYKNELTQRNKTATHRHLLTVNRAIGNVASTIAKKKGGTIFANASSRTMGCGGVVGYGMEMVCVIWASIVCYVVAK